MNVSTFAKGALKSLICNQTLISILTGALRSSEKRTTQIFKVLKVYLQSCAATVEK